MPWSDYHKCEICGGPGYSTRKCVDLCKYHTDWWDNETDDCKSDHEVARMEVVSLMNIQETVIFTGSRKDAFGEYHKQWMNLFAKIPEDYNRANGSEEFFDTAVDEYTQVALDGDHPSVFYVMRKVSRK